ncbi:MAG: 23S rRNA (adenine(2503)-C(2))-methyltransferase RlmN [Mariprofundales bacterium]
MRPLSGMTRDELIALCNQFSVSTTHAKRLVSALYKHQVPSLTMIDGLPKIFVKALQHKILYADYQLSTQQLANDGVRKILLRLHDDQQIESVLIPNNTRVTQCISTQVGCALGCRFCLTAVGGLLRNLSSAEMVAQLIAARNHTPLRATNIVLMGMGEPLHNYAETAKFVQIAADPLGFAIPPARITISTAGLIPGIERLISERLPCHLAISLNAPDDITRNKIMPINRKYPIKDLIKCLHDYSRYLNKRVLIEYVLLNGVNDSDEHAFALLNLLHGLRCVVNLLPLNKHDSTEYTRPDDNRIDEFRNILMAGNIMTVIRGSRGHDILAACGQLQRRQQSQQTKDECLADVSNNY